MNNPVQVVLNHEDFIAAPEKGRGGPIADPFKGRDQEFASHKKSILSQISAIAQSLDVSEYGHVGYTRVLLQEGALAKSSRPTRTLFSPRNACPVGAGSLGELFYRVSSDNIEQLAEAVIAAEETAKWSKDTLGRDIALASAARADVAAVAELTLPDPQDKRVFDVRHGIEWLKHPDTDGRYQIELFERITDDIARSDPRAKLFRSLRDLLREVGRSAVELDVNQSHDGLLMMRIASSSGAAGAKGDPNGSALDDEVRLHRVVLNRLARHPLVRKISLPLRLRLAETASSGRKTGASYKPTDRNPDSRYPKVGVIDSGVDDALGSWVEARSEYLDPVQLKREHGTGVAGLLIEARNLNGSIIGRETDGCLIYDLPLYIDGKFKESFNSFEDFLNQIDLEVGEMVSSHGVRVFNMSITATAAVDGDHYGRLARRLDEIQARHDVIFVIAAGNLQLAGRRSPWPSKHGDVLRYFAARTQADPIFQPAESVRSVCVGALNPDLKGHVFAAPTTYTCRGPGLKVGCKPDVAHFGGALPSTGAATGLTTVTVGGDTIECAGTSMAAPLVAKTLATIEAKLEDRYPAHVLHALLVHNSDLPDCLKSPRLREIARQFCGFGVPSSTDEMLTTDDSSITLVFNSALPAVAGRAQVMKFEFNWPAELVDEAGLCSGVAKMTLVARPPLDHAYGAEFVRVNVDAKLQQRQPVVTRRDGKFSYKNEIEYLSFRRDAGQKGVDRDLIKHGLRWWPVKQYLVDLGTGRGASSRWRIEVDSTARGGQAIPASVPFSLILTISDPERRPIFQSMRRSLTVNNVALKDIRVSSRPRQRSRTNG